jgi:hypothetical protein
MSGYQRTLQMYCPFISVEGRPTFGALFVHYNLQIR